jgi:1-aminocyclopropane-1-carboxylate deaminase/D-cysteine desulfhydrase-like pyridoxal-dependent ACC family enzyme
MTVETEAAVKLLAHQEGIILDPVYTGKAFAGLFDLIGQEYFGAEEQVIFLHTGGGPGLFRN